MTLYLVVADDGNGENKDLFVMADSPKEAVAMMFAYYEHDWTDFDSDFIRVFAVPMPLKTGPIDWPEPTAIPRP